MTGLSQDQMEMRAQIKKSATTWGVIVGVIAGLLAIWILGGQNSAVRYGGAVLIALALGAIVYRASFRSGSKSAQCEKCGAAFSRSRTDRKETLAGSEDMEEREELEDKSVKVTRWVEDRYDVVDTYTCAKCGDATTKTYQSTRRRDEAETIEPAPKTASAKSGAAATVMSEQPGKSAKSAGTATKAPSAGGKTAKSGKSGGGKSSAGKSSGGKGGKGGKT